jgi:hypothetical protein
MTPTTTSKARTGAETPLTLGPSGDVGWRSLGLGKGMSKGLSQALSGKSVISSTYRALVFTTVHNGWVANLSSFGAAGPFNARSWPGHVLTSQSKHAQHLEGYTEVHATKSNELQNLIS